MRAMTRDPNAAARARKAEEKAGGVISIQIGAEGGASGGSGGSGGGGASGFKKGGFKKSGFKSAFTPVGGEGEKGEVKKEEETREEDVKKVKSLGLQRVGGGAGDVTMESDTEDEGYEMYDPRFPTD